MEDGRRELAIDSTQEDKVELKLVMDKQGFALFQKLAADRGVSPVEVIREALALERVFASSRLDDDEKTKLYF